MSNSHDLCHESLCDAYHFVLLHSLALLMLDLAAEQGVLPQLPDAVRQSLGVMYVLSDRQTPEKLAAQKVTVAGTLFEKTKILKLSRIESAAGMDLHAGHMH